MNAAAEMPRYQSHKKVWALKIKEIIRTPDGGSQILPAEKGFAAFQVSPEYVSKHEPKVGGYYVVYPDGYKSFSPAEAFEDGYTLI